MSQVVVGQVWGDRDKRRAGRTFEVVDVVNNEAVCDVLSKSSGNTRSRKRTNIRLDRFKPKYYVLEKNASVTVKKKAVPKSNGSTPSPARQLLATMAAQGAAPNTLGSLKDECERVLCGNWGSAGVYAVLTNKRVDVVVREVRKDCYDIKARLDGHLIYSDVGHANLQTSLGQLRAVMKSWRDNLSDIVE